MDSPNSARADDIRPYRALWNGAESGRGVPLPCGVGFGAEGQTASSRRMISRKRSAMGVKVWYLFQMR